MDSTRGRRRSKVDPPSGIERRSSRVSIVDLTSVRRGSVTM